MANFNTGYKRYINRGLYITSTNTLIHKEPNAAGTNHIPDVQDTGMCPLSVAKPAHPTGITAIEFAPDICGSYIRVSWTETALATYYRVTATVDSVVTSFTQVSGTSVDLPFRGSTCTEVGVMACNETGCSISQPLTVNISNSITTVPNAPESFDVIIYEDFDDHYTTIGSWNSSDCALYYEYAGDTNFTLETIQDSSNPTEYVMNGGINTYPPLRPRLRACSSFGCSAWIYFGDSSGRFPPNRPTGTAIGTTGFTLNWNVPFMHTGYFTVNGYKIYRDGVYHSSTNASTTTAIITGETAFSTSKWTVAATLSGTDSPQSAYLSQKLAQADVDPPTAPRDLFGQNVKNTEFKLYWTRAEDNRGIATYQVFVDGTLHIEVDGVYSNFMITGLTKNTTYAITMKAIDTSGNISILSESISVTMANLPEGVPGKPTALFADNITNTTFDLEWVPPTDPGDDPITGYKIFKNGAATHEFIVGLITEFTVTGQTIDSNNTWTMKTVNVNGDSAASNGLAVHQTNNAGFTSYLSTLSSKGHSCELLVETERWHDGTGLYPTLTDKVYNTNLATDLLDGQNRNFTDKGRNVYKIDPVGVLSEYASCGTDTTAPIPPTGIYGNSISSNHTGFVIHWTDERDNVAVTGFRIYKDDVLFHDTLDTNTSYAITGLVANSQSEWKVSAYDAENNESIIPSTGTTVHLKSQYVSISTTSATTGSAACNLGGFVDKYFIGNGSSPAYNDVVYNDISGLSANAFDGGGNYWKETMAPKSHQISSTGYINNVHTCT